MLIVSCKKDNDQDPVNPDDIRVYTATAYFANGNIASLKRYSYNEGGVLRREVVFYVGDSVAGDTTNVLKFYTDYLMPDNTTLLVLSYGVEPGYTTGTDSTRWYLNDNKLAIRAIKTRLKPEGLAYTLFTNAYNQEGYCTINRSIHYISDSISDTNAIIIPITGR